MRNRISFASASHILCTLCIIFLLPTSGRAEDLPREITVTASERIWSAPSTARVSLEIRNSTKNAVSADAANDKAAESLKAAVGRITRDATFETRGRRFTGAGGKPGFPITQGTAIDASLYVGIRLINAGNVPAVIDAARNTPGCTVIDVDYYPTEDKDLSATIELLTRRVKEKANTIATSLGAKLGPLGSALLTEEADGSALRKQLQRPGDPSRFSDRERTLMLSTRFELIPPGN